MKVSINIKLVKILWMNCWGYYLNFFVHGFKMHKYCTRALSLNINYTLNVTSFKTMKSKVHKRCYMLTMISFKITKKINTNH